MIFQKGDKVPDSLFYCPEGTNATFRVSGELAQEDNYVKVILDYAPQEGDCAIFLDFQSNVYPIQQTPLVFITPNANKIQVDKIQGE